MTIRNLGMLCVLALGISAGGCATMGDKTVADAKSASQPKDEKPKGFLRELMDSGYLANTKSPSAPLYP